MREGWTTNDKGPIAETAILAEAVKLGIVVLRPVVEGCRYDLMFDLGPTLLRVQCKWGTLRSGVIGVRTATCRHTPRWVRSHDLLGTRDRRDRRVVRGSAARVRPADPGARGPGIRPLEVGPGKEQPGEECKMGGAVRARGYSSVGRARDWQSRGRRFEPG